MPHKGGGSEPSEHSEGARIRPRSSGKELAVGADLRAGSRILDTSVEPVGTEFLRALHLLSVL